MENKPKDTYWKVINIEGKEMNAIIKVYDEPIKKTDNVRIYTTLEITDGDIEWGNANWGAQLENESEANNVFEDILKRPNVYKAIIPKKNETH